MTSTKHKLEISFGAARALELGIEPSDIGVFGRQTMSSTCLFEEEIGYVHTGRVRKIAIIAMRTPLNDPAIPEYIKIRNPGDRWVSEAGGSALKILRFFDVKKFLMSEEKSLLLIEAINEDLMACFKKHEWDIHAVKNAYKNIKNSDLSFNKLVYSFIDNDKNKIIDLFVFATHEFGELQLFIDKNKSSSTRVENWTDWIKNKVHCKGIVGDRIIFCTKNNSDIKFPI